MAHFTNAMQSDETTDKRRRVVLNIRDVVPVSAIDVATAAAATALGDAARAVAKLQEKVATLRQDLLTERRQRATEKRWYGQAATEQVKEQMKEQVSAEVAAILVKKPDAYSWDYINLSARHRFVFTGLTKKQLKLLLGSFCWKWVWPTYTTRCFRRRRSTSKYMTRCACSS